jgi:acyl carrier protein
MTREQHDGGLAAGEESPVTEAVLRAALRRVMPVEGDVVALDTSLEALQIDSLLLAELVVEIEEELSMLLELDVQHRIETLLDLRRALREVTPR